MISARFLEPASREFDDEIAYLDQQLPGLGDRFEEEVRFAVSRVLEHPEIGPSLTRNIRKLRLRAFPFNIIYAVEQTEIVIIAVAAHRRRPNYWASRVPSAR